MDNVSKELVNKLETLNDKVYKIYNRPDFKRTSLRKKLNTISEIVTLNKMNPNHIPLKMACIDGSVNKIGSTYPHYIELYQGLAKVSEEEDIFLGEIYTPLLDNGEEKQRDQLLSSIEIETALKATEVEGLDLILMDGGLLRYHIDVEEKFRKLKNICLSKDIILAGFIKEVKTDILYPAISEATNDYNYYDKDLLYGVLDIGEALPMPDSINIKYESGISSVLHRLSNYPGVTGIDLLVEQSNKLRSVAELCYTLVPSMSRGVPMIIDIVDQEVLLSDRITEEIIKSYIDIDIFERFFTSERSMRRY